MEKIKILQKQSMQHYTFKSNSFKKISIFCEEEKVLFVDKQTWPFFQRTVALKKHWSGFFRDS